MTDPIRVISKIKNNRLMEFRESLNMGCREFAEKVAGVSYQMYLDLESMRRYPTEKMARKIAEATGMGVDYLFPGFLKRVARTTAVTSIPEFACVSLQEASQKVLPSPEAAYFRKEMSRVIRDILSKHLSVREAFVVRARFNGATLEELSKKHGVSRGRIRQIEWAALTKLRRPGVRETLAPFAFLERGNLGVSAEGCTVTVRDTVTAVNTPSIIVTVICY